MNGSYFADRLMPGTNDSKPYNWDEARFAREYEELVMELKDMPWPHRLVLFGRESGFQVIDLYALTETHPEYFDDGVHPNELGNRVIAEHIRKEIGF